MSPATALKLLAFLLTSLSAGMLAAAAEERPRLEDYPSSYAFLQALESWNRAHPDGAAPVAKASPPPQAAAPVVTDPTSELAPPPFEITGPESLDTAVEKARSIEHPAYKEKIRYHRTTHLSFPLHSIDGQDMSQASVGDTLDIKGKTEEERKRELEKLTQQVEQDRLSNLQAKDERAPFAAQPQSISNNLLGGGNRATQDISVTSH